MNRKVLFWPFLRPFSSKRQADYLRSFGSKRHSRARGSFVAIRVQKKKRIMKQLMFIVYIDIDIMTQRVTFYIDGWLPEKWRPANVVR